ncbi:hypothetical protein Bpfe_016739 [Biomphalaria pfeifferi]|uniref:Apextrin C-terminal domain-containing protein n=1 Tax=Biomphalaria pfeifferi TaxID=112525 RepID=A0AAD8BHR2_BIOPF|nr:hypothetical protein Bpfe_016739 [Biomphalaria pfeifferi]
MTYHLDHLILLVSFFQTGQCGFLLTASSKTVEIGVTPGFQFECSYWGNVATSDIVNLTYIEINRVDDTGKFASLIRRDDQGNTITSSILDPSAIVTSKMNTIDDSNLFVKWPIATAEIAGKFSCDIGGLDASGNMINEPSPVVVVNATNVATTDVPTLISTATKEAKDFCEHLVSEVYTNMTDRINGIQNASSNFCAQGSCDTSELKEMIQNQTLELRSMQTEVLEFRQNQSQYSAFVAEMTAQNLTREMKDYCGILVSDIYNNLTVTMDGITTTLNSSCAQSSLETIELKEIIQNQTAELGALQAVVNELRLNQSQYISLARELNALKDKVALLADIKLWPEGTYGLLMSESGCPVNSHTLWDSGYRKFLTASNSPSQNYVDPHTHLMKPTLETNNGDNFMYLHFCVTAARSEGGPWPRGTYCIHNLGTCPPGFGMGYAYISGDKNHRVSFNNGSVPTLNSGADYTQIFYCCRSDGPADVAIYLPNTEPFYLYRYQGTCQIVENMKVETEHVVMDTSFLDREVMDFYENSYHPDGQVNNWSFELCYYH